MAAESFFAMMKHRSPALVVETEWAGPVKRMLAPVRHRLGDAPRAASKKEVLRLLGARALSEMRAFYSKHDGAEICIDPDAAEGDPKMALVTIHPASAWADVTATYRGEGEWAWTIELCSTKKARTFYRGEADWIVIATIEEGPACLTAVLDGPDAGKIYYLAPEPGWNIMNPVAKSFDGLLARIGDDPAAFLRHVSAHVTRTSPHGDCHGLRPLAYSANGKLP